MCATNLGRSDDRHFRLSVLDNRINHHHAREKTSPHTLSCMRDRLKFIYCKCTTMKASRDKLGWSEGVWEFKIKHSRPPGYAEDAGDRTACSLTRRLMKPLKKLSTR